jgi:hydroxymethylpyrimidine pyrophosphatase-like HAD family hydrolase
MRIKAIILDVDGVIVGERIGFNSPWPNLAVTEALKNIRHKGIPICLITAKPSFAIRKIIQDAQLHNPHITDGGAVVIDPIDNVIVKSHTLEKGVSLQVLEMLLKNNIYTEFYTVSKYFVSESQVSEVTA